MLDTAVQYDYFHDTGRSGVCMNSPLREIRRVRHEVKQRRLQVDKITAITPKMLRITLAGAELAGFTSLGFDDHIKLFFPKEPMIEKQPVPGSEPAERPPMRDYTPRYDAAAGVLHVDFAIHDAGPATDWALQARVGDSLSIGGPRGSAIIPLEFDWYLFIGDETALPAIGRRLEELPAGSHAVVIVEVEDAAEEQSFTSKAKLRIHWVHRHGAPAGSGDALSAALRTSEFLPGDCFAWAAAESNVARALRRVLIDERGVNRSWVKAAGYWKRGAAAVHDTIDD
jgi:NADPH-dependent ferric siderophore reductase